MNNKIKELQPVTLYVLNMEDKKIKEAIRTVFEDQVEEIEEFSSQVIVHLYNEGKLIFHIENEKEYIVGQRQGMHNYYQRVPMKDKELLKNITTQMLLFEAIVGIQIYASEADAQDILDNIFIIARMLGCFVLYPTMSLYTAQGKLLINLKGESDFESYLPFLNVEDKVIESEADKKRRKFTIQKMKQEKFSKILEEVPSHARDINTNLYDVEAIVNRLTACFATNVKSEMLMQEVYDEKQWEDAYSSLNQRYDVDKYFSEEEEQFIRFGERSQANIFGWRYECSAMFAWVLSLMDYPPVSNICDVPKLASILWNSTKEELIDKAKLKSKEEVLQTYDSLFRYHWAAVDARV